MPRLANTQFRYTPDAGTVVGPVECGVCGATMNENRKQHGPRSSAGAMAGIKDHYDEFLCPFHDELWHKQAVAIRREAMQTASGVFRRMLLNEATVLIGSREASIDKLPLA